MNNFIKPKIILALDDERPSLDLVRAVFRKPTWKLICLQQEDQFHNMVAETQPDLILMDQNLARRTGIELCEELRRYVMKWYCSSLLSKWREEAALQAGAQGYLRKPIAPCQLRQQVEKHLA